MCIFCLGVLNIGLAQQSIRGTVLSAADSLPLAGVNVVINDIVRATTNRDGQFELVISGGTGAVSLTRIGYESLAVPKIKNGIALYMRPFEHLIDVVEVNTGYQRIAKERATGSFEHVDSTLFHRQFSTDIISRLEGVASGLLFDKRNGQLNPHTMSIRGLSTLTSTMAKPLIVVDNFPYEGDITNINPSDVESVTLLRDAAASSIWGARAGNGVLVVTTKRPLFSHSARLEVSAKTNVQKRPDLYYQPQIKPTDFIDVERFLFENGAYDVRLNNRTNYPVVSPIVEILNDLRNGEITESEAEQEVAYWRQFDVRDDLYKYFYRNAIHQQYNATLTGGTQQVTYRVSVGHDRNANNQVGNRLSRTTLRLSNQYKPVEKLRLEATLSFNNTRTTLNHPTTISHGPSIPLYPYARLADQDGSPLALEKQYRKGFIDTAGNGQLLDWSYRPLDELFRTNNSIDLNSMIFQFGATQKIAPWLDLDARYQYQYQRSDNHNMQGEELWETRDLINRYTQIVNDQPVYVVPRGSILDQVHHSLQAHNVRVQVNIDRAWPDGHILNAIAGTEVRDNTQYSNTHRTWGVDPNTMSYQVVDLVNRHPLYGTLGGMATIPNRGHFAGYRDRFVSFYSNFAYSYDGRYSISASIRRDASNLFGVSTNNRWKPLWSAGIAYTISNEGWYDIDILPTLKIRATYGYSGNVSNNTPALATIQYESGPTQLNRFLHARLNNPPNPELRWEQVEILNFGFNFALPNNRIHGSAEYYRKRSTDLMALVPWDPSAGVTMLLANAANMDNRGIDINLSAVPIDKSIKWYSHFLFSFNNHKVTKHMQERKPYMLPQAGLTLIPIEGHSAYSVISYRWAGLDPETGDPRGYFQGEISSDYQRLNRGEVTLDDLVFHGSAIPQYFGSLRNTLSWRKLDLSVNIMYRMDYYFRKPTVRYASLVAGNVVHGDYYHRWQKKGDENFTNVPSMIYPNNTQRDDFYRDSEVNVFSGNHIRLQDVVLNYRLDTPWLKSRVGVDVIVVSAQTNNLGIFLWRANNKGIDPDFLNMPIPPNLAIGLNIQF